MDSDVDMYFSQVYSVNPKLFENRKNFRNSVASFKKFAF